MKKMSLIVVLLATLFNLNIKAQDYNFSIENIPQELLVDANSVDRFNNTTVDIVDRSYVNCTFDVATTIINKQADVYNNLTIYYNPNRKIKDIKVDIYDKNGNRIKKIREKDFKDYSASDGSLFVEQRVKHYKYTPVSYPYTIHFTYEIASSNTAFIPDWIYLNSFNKSVEKSKFTLIYPNYINVKTSFSNFENWNVKVDTLPKQIDIVANNIQAIKYEALTAPLSKIVPVINFGINKFNLEGEIGNAENWEEYGKWYYENLIANTLNLDQNTILKIKELTKNAKTDLEKAKLVYKYVQDKVRYISIQIGIGGFKPMKAEDVDRLGYGDCKGLTNYTAALLKAVGINSYHTLVYGGEPKNINSKIASQEGNHMILYLPLNNQDYWLECTSQIHAFGELGDFTDDRDVLVITSNGGIIKRTKSYTAEESLQHTKGSMRISNDGVLEANISLRATGLQYDSHLQSYSGKNPSEINKTVKNYFSNINNIQLVKAEMLNNKDANCYEEEFEFSAPNYAVITNNQFYFTINAFNKSAYIPKRVRNRKLPFNLSTSYLDVDEIEIALPKNYKLEQLPENVEINTKFGSYKTTLEKIDDNTLVYKRELLINKGTYPAEDYELYRNFRKSIRKVDNSKLHLTKK